MVLPTPVPASASIRRGAPSRSRGSKAKAVSAAKVAWVGRASSRPARKRSSDRRACAASALIGFEPGSPSGAVSSHSGKRDQTSSPAPRHARPIGLERRACSASGPHAQPARFRVSASASASSRVGSRVLGQLGKEVLADLAEGPGLRRRALSAPAGPAPAPARRRRARRTGPDAQRRKAPGRHKGNATALAAPSRGAATTGWRGRGSPASAASFRARRRGRGRARLLRPPSPARGPGVTASAGGSTTAVSLGVISLHVEAITEAESADIRLCSACARKRNRNSSLRSIAAAFDAATSWPQLHRHDMRHGGDPRLGET